ncbi:hypothetical protein [Halomonas sp. MCCC 1A11062]|uniref:hypothetical protein n=1 Tax=Halomonas sp. MCCC 1A11062 TaxID=2733485 RepID=UPI001F45A17E|nr:hypothetical protein [Halomonas sp. MCCC 1A11062]MCE8038496.1 hypothetical protein [Halomonas sp. MCCC 1A11062]
MEKLKLVALSGVLISVMFVIGCAGEKEIDQEGLGVKAKFDQLEAAHKARIAILDDLEDKALAQLLGQAQSGNYYSVLDLVPFHMGPGQFEYAQPWLLRMEDYADIADLTDAYVQSLLAFSSYDHPPCMRYSDHHGFKLSQGFEFPFRHYLDFSQITFEDGRTIEIPEVANQQRETADVVYTGESFCFKAPFTAGDPQPLKVTGEFHADLPSDLLEFEFTADDVGKTAEQGGYFVTLLEFENGRYVIEVDAEEGTPMNFGNRDILAEAVDDHGNYIAWRATERAPTSRSQRIDEVLEDLFQRAEQGSLDEDEARSELEALRDTLHEEEGRKLFLGRAFNGIVDKARITLMVYTEESESVSHELELPVHNFPHPLKIDDGNLDALPVIPPTAPVYSTREEHRLPTVELDDALMQERIRMSQWHEKGEGLDPDREHSGQIGWFYPPVQSDLFMEKEDRAGALHVLGTFEFYDAQGERVEAREPRENESEVIAFEYKPGDRGVSVVYPRMFGRLDYSPERFTETPARVKGTLPMIVAPNLIKDSFAKDELPAGMTLNGNQLVVDYAVFEPREVEEVRDDRNERRNQIFVKDSQGYLVEIMKRTYFNHQPQRTPVDVYYFYGQPESVEIWYKGATTLVDYEFDFELVTNALQAQ